MWGKILNWLGLFIGICLCLYVIRMIANVRNVFELAVITYFAMGLSGIAGLIFASIFCPKFSHWLWKNFYWASGSIKAPPPEFPIIRAKIAKGEYAEAERDLIKMLEADNGNPHIIELLTELYVDKIHNFKKAEGMLKAYLSKDERNISDLQFVMALADIYNENHNYQSEIDLLRREFELFRDKYAKKTLKNRLTALESTSHSSLNPNAQR